MFRIKFPSLASPCVELVCIHATYAVAGCEALYAVSLYTDALVSGLDLDPNERTSYFLIIYLRCVLTCIISISFDTSHYVGIEICRRYSRSTYRYIPKISNDISRSLDTIPNTTSKLVRTHTWGYASLPQLFTVQRILLLYLYTLGFVNPQHPEPAEST